MFGTTLREIRRHVDVLTCDDGPYYLACARTGDRPIPAAGKRFDDRRLARIAARATEQYRMALRRYDPQLPFHDVIVCEARGGGSADEGDPGTSPDDPSAPVDAEGAPDRDGVSGPEDASPPRRRRRIEYCHAVASAVFETLAEAGHEAVETAVVDDYLELAEEAGADRLCLCLLESTATALDAHLAPAEQADVLRRAAARLEPARDSEPRVLDAFGRLRRAGLLEEYVRSPWSVDRDDGTRSVVVRLSGYALSPRAGRLPVLPLVVDLYRSETGLSPASVAVEETGDGWRVTLELAPGACPRGDPAGTGCGVDGMDGGFAAVPIRPRR